MQIRKAVVAGQFYPGDRETCLAHIRECLPAKAPAEALPERPVAGIVPHAGWTFSGALAAQVFSAIKQRRPKVETFVVLGAAHGYFGSQPTVDGSDAWETPLGRTNLDDPLRQFLADCGAAVVDSSAHKHEHSIEVQIPFIQHLFPDARILPVIVPATESAMVLGRALAERSLCGDASSHPPAADAESPIPDEAGGAIIYIGSTDLTHYGPRYGFTPMGIGSEALHWASGVNDRQFIDLALTLEPERLLANALESGNACGPGAAAAAVTVARRLGARKGILLAHTTSNEVMLRQMGTASRDSVGYAAIVF